MPSRFGRLDLPLVVVGKNDHGKTSIRLRKCTHTKAVLLNELYRSVLHCNAYALRVLGELYPCGTEYHARDGRFIARALFDYV